MIFSFNLNFSLLELSEGISQPPNCQPSGADVPRDSDGVQNDPDVSHPTAEEGILLAVEGGVGSAGQGALPPWPSCPQLRVVGPPKGEVGEAASGGGPGPGPQGGAGRGLGAAEDPGERVLVHQAQLPKLPVGTPPLPLDPLEDDVVGLGFGRRGVGQAGFGPRSQGQAAAKAPTACPPQPEEEPDEDGGGLAEVAAPRLLQQEGEEGAERHHPGHHLPSHPSYNS